MANIFIIRRLADSSVVAKFDVQSRFEMPTDVQESDRFVIEELENVSDLDKHDIDQSTLTDSERSIIKDIFPVDFDHS